MPTIVLKHDSVFHCNSCIKVVEDACENSEIDAYLEEVLGMRIYLSFDENDLTFEEIKNQIEELYYENELIVPEIKIA